MKISTKIQRIQDSLQESLKAAEEGEVNILDLYINMKKLSDSIDKQMKEIKSEAMTELSKHGKGEHLIEGAIVSLSNTGGRWDFKHIKDWSVQKGKLIEIEDKFKSAFKAHEKGLMSVESDTGEIPVLPKYSGSTETIKIKIPKK